MKRLIITCFLFVFGLSISAQTAVYRTFKDTRIINSHSVETLAKRKLDIRIGHRFGDLLGDNGGWPTFYGLESATDILIGAEYGFTNNLSAGVYRTKGAGPLKQLINGSLKYRIIQQADGGSPISLVVLGVGSISTMSKDEDSPGLDRFPKFAHRMAYSGQVLIARKFSDNFSLQFTPAYTHRNLVVNDDTNGIFSLGAATRIQLNKVWGLIAEAVIPLNGPQNPFRKSPDLLPEYFPTLSLGFEIDTGGHIFQINFTNATGIIATDFIPNNTNDWLSGEFRLGFTISRTFNL